MLVCTNCRQGLMDPIRDEDEPEYTDRYQCGHCGHTATIPSILILCSQIVSALLGGGITLYLLQRHGAEVLNLFHDGTNSTELLPDAGLAAAALVLLSAFIYLLYRAGKGIGKRMRYRLPPPRTD
ncbi:MAG: hypothetical protein ACQERE_07080 [Pseudomonadota bacterium]